jgi:hypothetical protein
LHIEELHDPYLSPNIKPISVVQTKKNEMPGARGTYGEDNTCTLGFGGKTWGEKTTWKTQAYVGE